MSFLGNLRGDYQALKNEFGSYENQTFDNPIVRGTLYLKRSYDQMTIGPDGDTIVDFDTPSAKRRITVPDAKANSSVLLSEGDKTVNGLTNITNLRSNGAVVMTLSTIQTATALKSFNHASGTRFYNIVGLHNTSGFTDSGRFIGVGAGTPGGEFYELPDLPGVSGTFLVDYGTQEIPGNKNFTGELKKSGVSVATDDTTIVRTTGNQDVDGIKDFKQTPKVPSITVGGNTTLTSQTGAAQTVRFPASGLTTVDVVYSSEPTSHDHIVLTDETEQIRFTHIDAKTPQTTKVTSVNPAAAQEVKLIDYGSSTVEIIGDQGVQTLHDKTIYFPTTGGTPSALNFYEEFSDTMTLDSKLFSGGVNGPFTYELRRIGKIVVMSMQGFQFTVDNSDDDYFVTTSGEEIPTRFRPNRTYSYVKVVQQYSKIIVGTISISTTGVVAFSRCGVDGGGVDPVVGQQFTNNSSVQAGWDPFCMTWNIA